MDHGARSRLLKILALADSSHEGEAMAAVRMARQLLAQEGLSFADLAGNLGRSALLRHLPEQRAVQVRALELQVSELQRRLLEAQNTIQERNNALAAVNNRVQQLDQQMGRQQAEVEKWRNLARDTANKLWDIGQQIAEDRAVSETVTENLQQIGGRSHPSVGAAPLVKSNFRRERR